MLIHRQAQRLFVFGHNADGDISKRCHSCNDLSEKKYIFKGHVSVTVYIGIGKIGIGKGCNTGNYLSENKNIWLYFSLAFMYISISCLAI